jgi:hypothetical protein
MPNDNSRIIVKKIQRLIEYYISKYTKNNQLKLKEIILNWKNWYNYSLYSNKFIMLFNGK